MGYTGAIKNLMGCVSPKGSMHPRGSVDILHKRLRDLYYLLRNRIAWVLLDGIVGAEYSEQYGTPKFAGILASGSCMFEIDATGAQIVGYLSRDIEYLRLIEQQQGWGVPRIAPRWRRDFERSLYYKKSVPV